MSMDAAGRAVFRSMLFTVALAVWVSSSHVSEAQGTPTGTVPQTYNGMMYASTADVNSGSTLYPPAFTRIWDTNGLVWPAFETGDGTWNATTFSNLDSYLAAAWPQTVGLYGTAMMALSRTPQWASTQGLDANCNYYNSSNPSGIGAPGQCYVPMDVAVDGTGTDAIWKAWVTKVVNWANGKDPNQPAGYLYPDCSNLHTVCHAHISYWEIWNEFDVAGNDSYNTSGDYTNPTTAVTDSTSYIGTYAQLVRLMEDARCIIKGSGAISWIHNAGNSGPDGHSAACTASGIDPTAEIVMPSSHAQGSFGLDTVQNLFYCDGPTYAVGKSGNVTTGAPEYCNTGTAGAAAVDVIDFHMKPGNEADGFGDGATGPTMENEMLDEYCHVIGATYVTECSSLNPTNYPGILQARERALPFFNGEGGYSGNSTDGWVGGVGSGALDLSQNPDYQASFVARYMLYQWSLGITNFDWYQVDGGSFLETTNPVALTEAGQAFKTISPQWLGGWLDLASMTSPCANTIGSQWECDFDYHSGLFSRAALWDTDYVTYSCPDVADNGLGCITHLVAVPSTFTQYEDVFGNKHTITNSQVPVGIIPIWLIAGRTR